MKLMYYTLISLVIFCTNIMPLTPEQLLKTLSLEQKIGQLFIATAVADDESATVAIEKRKDLYHIDGEYVQELIEKYHVGGIIYFGKGTPEKQIERTAHFQRISTIPLLVLQDLEPGRCAEFYLPGLPVFPDNEILGKITNNELIYELGTAFAKICKAIGVHINLAPVADVNNNPNNPVINKRSFGDNKENVAQKTIAFTQGMQDNGIFACAKHFPGHGDTNVDSHLDLSRIPHTRARLEDIEFYPFKELIKHKVACIMTAHLEVPALEPEQNKAATLSKNIVTNILQQELGFTGLIITDALEMKGVMKHTKAGECELEALCAGNDILLCSPNIPVAIETIKQAIIDGKLAEEELDTHVLKILHAKEEIFKHQNQIPTIENFKQLDREKLETLRDKLFAAAEKQPSDATT